MEVARKMKSLEFERRPWGTYTVLDEGEAYKVKRIEVLPEKRLSYQKHAFRSEHWTVISGVGRVTLNDESIEIGEGDSIDIGAGDKHRVENPHGQQRLIFIEVQRGDYLGEDDIVRFEDDFGRTKS